MSKGAKKSGGFLRRNVRADVPVREPKGRREKTKILIVGSGKETEPNYFDGLKRNQAVSDAFAVKVKKGPGRSPSQTVEYALRERQQAERRGEPYDAVWCVLDAEDLTVRSAIAEALELAASKGVEVCVSNPSFEVWFLAHYERKARPYKNCNEVVQELSAVWRKHNGRDYQKNDRRVYERLANLTEKAIENARWVRETHHDKNASTVDCNSSTDVYKLVGLLIGSKTRDL